MPVILIVFIVLLLSACGGGSEPPAALSQCNGTPKAAVVYVGPGVPAALAAIPNACVFTTDDAHLAQAVDAARTAASVPRVYIIGNGTDSPLNLMAARPGIANITSLWLAPAWSGDLGGTLASVYVNGPGQVVTTDHNGPVVWRPTVTAFDVDAAIADLYLGGAQ